MQLYTRLHRYYGEQHWWPADTPFEVVVGAILTQNTSWSNVVRAIDNLKKSRLLSINSMHKASHRQLQEAVYPSGFYKQKTERIRHFIQYIYDRYKGSLASFLRSPAGELREELLSLHGIGPETADSILLYASGKRFFVVDTYTRRICARLGICCGKDYDEIQAFFHERLPLDIGIYKEFHALIVVLAKNHCRVRPVCAGCPVKARCMFKAEGNRQ